MKVKLVVLALAVAGLAPVAAPAQHCQQIILLSGKALLVDPGVTCEVTGSEDPNTDYVVPGGTDWVVRWLFDSPRPDDGTVGQDGRVYGSQLRFAGLSTPLRFHSFESFWDSQLLNKQAASTVAGGNAEIQVCFPDRCITRVYRTVG